MSGLYSIQLLSVFLETFSYCSVQFVQRFFSAFHWSPSIGKPRMTPVSFVKTMESYEVSFVTINRQTSYDSRILRQDYGLIQRLLTNNMSHYRGSTVTGTDRNGGPNYRIGPDCAGRASLQ